MQLLQDVRYCPTVFLACLVPTFALGLSGAVGGQLGGLTDAGVLRHAIQAWMQAVRKGRGARIARRGCVSESHPPLIVPRSHPPDSHRSTTTSSRISSPQHRTYIITLCVRTERRITRQDFAWQTIPEPHTALPQLVSKPGTASDQP